MARTNLTKVDSYVWCDGLGEIHRNCLDPYNWGSNARENHCKVIDHRSVFVKYDPETERSHF